MTFDEYIQQVNDADDVRWLKRELIERMRINIGLVAENDQFKRRIQQFEEGAKPTR
jgi:hypothetical protein